MKKELFLYLERKLMLQIVWEKGNVQETSCFAPTLQVALDIWTSDGIREWIGLDSPEMRETKPTHPEFLARLADYITRQAGYEARLVYHAWGEPAPDSFREARLCGEPLVGMGCSCTLPFNHLFPYHAHVPKRKETSPTTEAVDALRVYEETWQKNSTKS